MQKPYVCNETRVRAHRNFDDHLPIKMVHRREHALWTVFSNVATPQYVQFYNFTKECKECGESNNVRMTACTSCGTGCFLKPAPQLVQAVTRLWFDSPHSLHL